MSMSIRNRRFHDLQSSRKPDLSLGVRQDVSPLSYRVVASLLATARPHLGVSWTEGLSYLERWDKIYISLGGVGLG